MPGWYDASRRQWWEDKFQVSTHTGNVAWAMLALLGYYEATGRTKPEYLNAAREMGEWVERRCRDARGAGGYTGGFEGWEPAPERLTYKATEHNIDLYPAFLRLNTDTGDPAWRERAEHARRFVLAMWDSTDGKFWTGTGLDGVTINRDVVPVDIQAWAVLALREEGRPYWRALDYAERALRVGEGFDFNQDKDGVWFEGTGQMAAAYAMTGHDAKWRSLVRYLEAAQDTSGGLFAADRDGLTTGFSLPDGQPWLYFHRLHTAPTAWLVLAAARVNPFWLGSS